MATSRLFAKRLVLPLGAIAGTGIAASLIASIDRSIELDLWQQASIHAASIVTTVFATSGLLRGIQSAPETARTAE